MFIKKDYIKIKFYVEKFLDEKLKDLLFQPVFMRLQKAKKQGAYTAILSNSPDFLVASIASRLGVDHHLGTRYVVGVEGRMECVTDFVMGSDKAEYVRQLQQKGIGIFKTTAYSDSALDIPFLQAVTHPVAVRPDRGLWKECKKQKWEVIW